MNSKSTCNVIISFLVVIRILVGNSRGSEPLAQGSFAGKLDGGFPD